MSEFALPPIDNAFLPADVRNGTKERRQQYDAALSFERQLVGELTKQLSKTAEPSDESGGSAATRTYRDMLPGAMADAVMAEGGLGLAQQIDQAMTPTASPSVGSASQSDALPGAEVAS